MSSLPRNHLTAIAFLDESGAIAHDRFFAVGCLKVAQPSRLTRAVQRLRDQRHWYEEIHFTALTRTSADHYLALIDVICQLDAAFSCFIADREVADPVVRFGSPWKAYESMASQLLLGSIGQDEIVTVLADAYSTPPNVVFEDDVKKEVNRRLGCLAVASVCRLDSKAADPLQVVDFLTSAVAFEYRQNQGMAGAGTPKAQVAAAFRQKVGVQTFLNGIRTTQRSGLSLNVAMYGKPGRGGPGGAAKKRENG